MYKIASRNLQRGRERGKRLKCNDPKVAFAAARLDRVAEERHAEAMAAYEAVKGKFFIVRKADAGKKKKPHVKGPFHTAPQAPVPGKVKRRRRRNRNRQAFNQSR